MGARILAVDDDEDTLSLLKDLLTGEGYEVETASNGEEALSRARARDPDLILLDVRMPDMDGFNVCRELAAERTGPPIPVIVLTGLESFTYSDGFLCETYGVETFIYKPFQPRQVSRVVRDTLAAKGLRGSRAPRGVKSSGDGEGPKSAEPGAEPIGAMPDGDAGARHSPPIVRREEP